MKGRKKIVRIKKNKDNETGKQEERKGKKRSGK